jgi:MarR family transcriptional regulator, 2-MHQ and catechol-resistance regulon repressor
MASPGSGPAEQAALADPLLTTMGLLFETHAGLLRDLERHLEQECGLSMHWFEVLLRLARSPGARLRMSDLADQTTLSNSGLTRAVDRLEAEGLVRREPAPTDRRGHYAVLTDAGAGRVHAAVPVHLEQVRGLLARALSAEQVDTLTGLLRILRDELNPEAAAASDPVP